MDLQCIIHNIEIIYKMCIINYILKVWIMALLANNIEINY